MAEMDSQDVGDGELQLDREEKENSPKLHEELRAVNIRDDGQQTHQEEEVHVPVQERIPEKEFPEDKGATSQQVQGNDSSELDVHGVSDVFAKGDNFTSIPGISQQQHSHCILGSFHQSDPSFKSSAGKQCIVTSVVAAAHAQLKLPDQWDTADLDQILVTGNDEYNNFQLSGPSHPEIEDIPAFFFTRQINAMTWMVLETLTGSLCVEEKLPNNLAKSLNQIFNNKGPRASSILVCNRYAIAIVKLEGFDSYAVIDQHAQNENGVYDHDGKAVVLLFKSLHKLTVGLLRLFSSLGARVDDQYELHQLAVFQTRIDEGEVNNDVDKNTAAEERVDEKEGIGRLKEKQELDLFLEELVHVINTGCEKSFHAANSRSFIIPNNGILQGDSVDAYIKEVKRTPTPRARLDSGNDKENAGDYGIVVNAVNVRTKKIFAVKMLKDTAEFKKEEVLIPWILLGSGCHDFLGIHYDLDEGRCTVYMMFTFMRGPTLADLIRKMHMPVTTEMCVRWLRQILGTLKLMFENGIVHSDIKESNIMFRTPKCQEIVLIDFGCAHIFNLLVPLGMEDGRIKDRQICRSSVFSSQHHESRARLNQSSDPPYGPAGAWVPYNDDQTEWIGVRFPKDTTVVGIATQGRHRSNMWVTDYVVSYKKEKDYTLRSVKATSGQQQVFVGNQDSHSNCIQMFPEPVVASEIRIHPQHWHESIALRFELYGPPGDEFFKGHGSDVGRAVDLMMRIMPFSNSVRNKAVKEVSNRGCHTAPGVLQDSITFWQYSKLGMEDWGIGDECLSASSSIDDNHTACAARLGVIPKCGPYNSLFGWRPKKGDRQPLITFDFKETQEVAGIATRGDEFRQCWVKQYIVSHKPTFDSIWEDIDDSEGCLMVFSRNKDNQGWIEQKFPREIETTALQIRPIRWCGYPVLKVRLQGSTEEISNIEEDPIEDECCDASALRDGNQITDNNRMANDRWHPIEGDRQPYITVNFFKSKRRITGVITQGHKYEQMWVTHYIVSYQTNSGGEWQDVKDSDGKIMVFGGNRDNSTPHMQIFPIGADVQAVAIQIQPLKWQGYPALRFELLGEPDGTRPAIGEHDLIAIFLQALEKYKEEETCAKKLS